jgi:hypothetical protein
VSDMRRIANIRCITNLSPIMFPLIKGEMPLVRCHPMNLGFVPAER